ncbi:hypothetical protein BDK51DRAFT_42857 [Blyttiomyces helicus]|uniref:Uncharacterized protein n=1 Tax=Blyttiomyces helicus TaxID=388810 RepID=A0A4P9W3Y5_9FUNG|nr:hypothetical protein BDK51DRAFT_42857 [Blyttiomyces helicus]|eukprot:RKO86874.1 hypothetical protein BDK51DRAFT_42857 [Blyttiomyces helicus]
MKLGFCGDACVHSYRLRVATHFLISHPTGTSLTRDGILSYKLIVFLCAPTALLLDRAVHKTPTPLFPAFALFLFLLGIGITTVQDFELTVFQESCAAAAAFFAALNQTWRRNAEWMGGLSGVDGLRVVAPWAVGGLLVPALSEAGAIWTYDLKGRDVASLVAACALFVTVSRYGIAAAKRLRWANNLVGMGYGAVERVVATAPSNLTFVFD